MIHNISPSTIKMGDENFLFYDNMDY
jgi:hypothetical protein